MKKWISLDNNISTRYDEKAQGVLLDFRNENFAVIISDNLFQTLIKEYFKYKAETGEFPIIQGGKKVNEQ